MIGDLELPTVFVEIEVVNKLEEKSLSPHTEFEDRRCLGSATR
jgi:hypothetical protein